MAKLSKTKSFTVSNDTLEVNFKTDKCEIANLLKSGIVNQNIVLIAFNNVWHEINVLDHGGDNSDLNSFKSYVESMNLGLVDFGIKAEKQKTDYSLTHDDFISLESKFPNYNYIEISKLNDFNVKNGLKSSVYKLTEDLKYLTEKNLTIDEHFKQTLESMEQSIQINNENSVATNVIETPVTPVIMSLQIFETMQPTHIEELKGLNERQLQIVKENPVIEITNKESYELAKKTAAILLKASTAIDGKEGVEATATKYLNTFKSMLKNAIQPIAKLTREPYDKQKQIINSWENAEALRIQAEQREKLEKINKRTDELFAVPFTFNGSVYNIGNVYVLPSQIENATDQEFQEFVNNGILAKKQIDAEFEIQKNKDAEIEALKAKLAAFENQAPATNAEVINKITETFDTSNVVTPNVTIPANTLSDNQTINVAVQATASTYVFPSVENKLLNALDLKNAEHLEKPAYIKCRGYYVSALIDVANLLENILNDNTPGAPKKSEQISNLVAILKQSK